MNQTHQKFIFGSDAETPHQQYVVHIDEGTLFRFIVWKFTADQVTAGQNPILQSDHQHVQVDGYNVFLFSQRYDAHEGKWKNITPQCSTPLRNIGQLLAPHAASFYLKYKINPNAKKFQRFEDHTAAAHEGISSAAYHSNP